jgi:hypothetical protein
MYDQHYTRKLQRCIFTQFKDYNSCISPWAYIESPSYSCAFGVISNLQFLKKKKRFKKKKKNLPIGFFVLNNVLQWWPFWISDPMITIFIYNVCSIMFVVSEKTLFIQILCTMLNNALWWQSFQIYHWQKNIHFTKDHLRINIPSKFDFKRFSKLQWRFIKHFKMAVTAILDLWATLHEKATTMFFLHISRAITLVANYIKKISGFRRWLNFCF